MWVLIHALGTCFRHLWSQICVTSLNKKACRYRYLLFVDVQQTRNITSKTRIRKKLCPDVNSLLNLTPWRHMWRQRSWSILVQVMACCLMAPCHYLNQSSVRFWGILLASVSHNVPRPLFSIMSWQIKLLSLLPHLREATELSCVVTSGPFY